MYISYTVCIYINIYKHVCMCVCLTTIKENEAMRKNTATDLSSFYPSSKKLVFATDKHHY